MTYRDHRRHGPTAILSAALLTGGAIVAGCAADPKDAGDRFIGPNPTTRPADERRLNFQTHRAWMPRTHLNADVAMVYGIDATLPERIKTWRDKGYQVEVMTGVAWGDYFDYTDGRWDGTPHLDEAQMQKNGETIGHGKDVYYMSPGINYGRYLSEGVIRALDAGATAVHLEEPEIWVRAGYEEQFKREWQDYYKEPWVDPVSSPEAQYRASKLKYFLYKRALGQVFAAVRAWSARNGGKYIPCYVPTHSLINYASWGIVSPESALLEVGCDGYIAQVWTGTSRTPNYYEGRKKERTFETAFLEYGVMQNLVRASGRRVWYLNDPIEDNPRHTWDDYQFNWESTLVASLLQPEVHSYEIMPWPERIFGERSRYPSGKGDERIVIPKAYETELQSVITALGDMKQPAEHVRWEVAGTQGIGVLIADTIMFQRFGPDASDGDLGSFYGLAMPLVKRGMPIDPVQVENVTQKADFLNRYKVLVLTYEGQKPPTPQFHEALARWVKAGGVLVVIDDDKDPYHAVREWWNTGPMSYTTPRLHLFETLGLSATPAGTLPTKVGKGAVIYDAASPAQLSHRRDGGDVLRALVKQAMDEAGIEWKQTAGLVLKRGPYIVAAGLDEAASDAPIPQLNGRYISLFDPNLATVNKVVLEPNSRKLLLDLNTVPAGRVGTIAAAARVRDEKVTDDAVTFRADGIERSNAVIVVALPAKPKSVSVDGTPLAADAWDHADGLLRIRFENKADGRDVQIER